MRRSIPAKLGLLSLVVLVSAQCARERELEEADGDSDHATLRRQAFAEWVDEAHAAGSAASGRFSLEYQRFLLETAARERSRWAELLPLPGARPGAAVGTYWMSLGPSRADFVKNGNTMLKVTDSGRVRSIAVDPADGKQIYVATAGGGLWKTADGGFTWTPMTDALGTLSCGALALDPANSDVLYLGLGDPFDGWGVGIVKSDDGGLSWSAPVFLGESTATLDIAVSRADPRLVLAATDAGLFRSTDGGASFGRVDLQTGHDAAPYVWSLAATGAHGFAVSLEGDHANRTETTDGQVWVSSDDGATWTRATGMEAASGVGRIALAAAPSSPQVLYAEAAVPNATTASDLADLFKSTDGGASWSALGATNKPYGGNTDQPSVGALLNGQGWYDQLVLVDPGDPDVVYFGGALLLAKTRDGGRTFVQLTQWLGKIGLPYVHADFHAGAFDGAGNLYIGTDGGIFRSPDGGRSFTAQLNVGLTTHLAYTVSSSQSDPAVVAGGLQDNGTRLRAGATRTWNQVVGGDGFGVDVNDGDARLMLGSLYFDEIVKSEDGGKTFAFACDGIDECGDSAGAPFRTRIVRWTGRKEGVAPGNEVFTFARKVVYRSEDYATSWSKLGTEGLPDDLYIRGLGVAHASDQTLGIVASRARVFLSTDGGATWTQAAEPPGNALSLSDIHFDTADPSTVYVASVAPVATATHLWRSTDLGRTWTAIDGQGLPAGVPVNLLRNDPNDPSVLYAGTQLGVYRSTDAGATWRRFGWGLPLVNVTDIYLSPDSRIVRVATFGRGFFELTPFRPRDPT